MSSRPKQYKCKQCQHVSMTKEEQWRHARTHIPPEKQLTCDRCEFVTEYKHHLEYHIRNHNGEKPFHCKECNYVCVNKSMLNLHMKSHNSLNNHRRAPGTVMSDRDANETDHFDKPSETGTSMALQQLSQQFARQCSSSATYTCQHCAIIFHDLALYQIHLGYHSYDNPYKCNRCGHVSQNSLQFNLHQYQDSHDVL